MAEGDTLPTPTSAGKGAGKFGFLTRKLGPLPVGVWLAMGLAVWWLVNKRKGTSTGSQTDPAGNIGTIDPATGYVYGSAEDIAAKGTSTDTSSATDASNTSGSTVAGSYPDNSSWARAAINYLVGRGIDPASANEAIQSWLASQQLTTTQQADVNLAIQGIGPPPDPPGPVGSPPTTIVTPPSGVVYATNPPSGVVVSGKTANTLTVKWNKTTNATGYTIRWGRTSAATDGNQNEAASAGQATIGGLAAGTLYYVQVQATPAKPGAGYGSTSATTSSTPSKGGGGGGSHTYTVRSGDTLSGIASRLKVSAATLYAQNKSEIEAAARAHGHSSSDNGHWIFPGTVLHY